MRRAVAVERGEGDQGDARVGGVRAWPTSGPPGARCSTPGGTPASSARRIRGGGDQRGLRRRPWRPRRCRRRGRRRSARGKMARGKFHGLMQATTPRPARLSSLSSPRRSRKPDRRAAKPRLDGVSNGRNPPPRALRRGRRPGSCRPRGSPAPRAGRGRVRAGSREAFQDRGASVGAARVPLRLEMCGDGDRFDDDGGVCPRRPCLSGGTCSTDRPWCAPRRPMPCRQRWARLRRARSQVFLHGSDQLGDKSVVR